MLLGRWVCVLPARYAGSLLLAISLTHGVSAAPTPPPPAVTVVPVPVDDVAPVYSFVGHVQAIQNVQLAARVTAFLQKIDFKEGSDVQQGQTLFELEKAPFQAAFQAAQAALDKAQANYNLAQVALDRASRLNQQGFEAQATLDQARATRDADAADVEAAKANLASAAVNLSYCTMIAPITGRIGASAYTIGNLVTPSSKPLATINQMDPIRVVFSVTDRDLLSVQQRRNASASEIAQGLTVSLKLANGTAYDQQGKISFLDNAVDPTTGTVAVWAEFANPNRLLVPGAFVSVEVRSAQPQERPLAPVAAVQTDEKGNYVLVVGPDNKVAQKRVSLGRQVAQNFIVDSGLSGGEHVITEGVQKVQPGQVVNPTEAQSSQNTAQSKSPGQGG